MVTEKVTKGIPKNNYCELCDYSTSHLGSFTKHLLTKRHKNREFGDAGDKKLTKTHQHVCSQCDKLFNSRNGLWKMNEGVFYRYKMLFIINDKIDLL